MFFRILAYRRDAQSNQPARKVRQTQIIEEIAGRAGLWRRGASVRGSVEFQPFSDAARTEPGFSGDVADRVSGVAQSTDLIKDGLPTAAMRLLGKVSMLRDFASASRTICDRHYAFVFGFRQQRSAR